MKYLGIDWGEKRIGLALGEGETKLASPFKTVQNLDEILQVLKNEEIDVAIVGRPTSIINNQFPISKQFENFVEGLKKSGIQIELYDERMSSKAADALEGDKKTKAGRDEMAAMIILQDYLDSLRQHEAR